MSTAMETNVSRDALLAEGRHFENAWGLIDGRVQVEASPARSNELLQPTGSAGG